MAKKIPLIQRLNNALSMTSSISEVEKVWGLAYKLGKDCLNKDLDDFYSNIDFSKLDCESEIIVSKNDIEKGKELVNLLTSSVNLPSQNTGKIRGYGRKIEKVLKFEYGKLKQFYK